MGFEQFSSVHFPQLEDLLGSQFNQPPTSTSSACGVDAVAEKWGLSEVHLLLTEEAKVPWG